MKKILNFINGDWHEPKTNQWLENFDPSSGSVYSLIPDSNEDDVSLAVESANTAFTSWRALAPSERARHLKNLARGIQERSEEFAEAETRDNGKPLELSRNLDIPRAIQNLEHYAEWATHLEEKAYWTEDKYLNVTRHEPLGVVGAISPWNLPLYLLTWKIAPALALGNTVVAKPSEVTPYTAYLLSDVCRSIGFPKGVLNIVHGLGGKAGEALVQSSGIKAVSFTGSTAVGKRIAKIAAESLKKVSLEMGGKNPTLVFEDCNLDESVDGAVKSAFTNSGQICLCGSRILIQKSIYEDFKKRFVAKVSELKVGSPLDSNTNIGPLVSKAHLEKVKTAIETAKSEGGNILLSNPLPELGGGYYLSPTVIDGLDPYCKTNQEEIFGPVVTLIPFKDESEAILWANCTDYGLAASIWTQNSDRVLRVSRQLESGIVWANCWMRRDLRTPFGGVKSSGVGREGGDWVLEFLTEPKNICIGWNS